MPESIPQPLLRPTGPVRPVAPTGPGVRGRLRTTLVALLAVLLTAGLALPAAASTGEPTTGDDSTAATSSDSGTGQPVVLVGVTGLRWDDVATLTTPALWGLSRTGAVGNNVVRSVRSFTCPSAGWLAVSAGARSDDLTVADGTCRTLRDPLPDSEVPGWEDYAAAADASGYESRLGLLGDLLAETGTTATGIGPGAAIALAGSDGMPTGTHMRTPNSTAALEDAVAGALDESDLLVVDAGNVRDPGYQTHGRSSSDGQAGVEDTDLPDLSGTDVVIEPSRAEQVQAFENQLAAVLTGVRRSARDATVLVVSLADSSRRAHLQLAVATGTTVQGTGEYAGGLIGSSSTRQPGLLQTTDLTPTLLTALGIRGDAPTGALVGAVVERQGDDRTATARVGGLIDQNRQAQAAKPLVAPFYLLWVGLNLALYIAVTLGLNSRVRQWVIRLLNRRWPKRRRLGGNPARVLTWLRVAAVAVAAVPVSTFLANLLPWWRAGSPGWALTGAVALNMAAITCVALLPRWRSSFLGPLGVVAGITAGVLTVDVATGARLAMDSMMGPGSLVAGRFYGFGNPGFALFATAMALTAVALANPLLQRGRRWAAAGVVAAIGLVATVVDGMPSIGADFGGPPALVPGFAIMALLVAGVRLNWRRVLALVAAGAVTVIGIALLDWLRPPDERTHLGRFIETVLDGGLWTVLVRKAQANLGILFGSEQTLLAIGGLVVVVLLLGWPARSVVDAPDGGPYAWLSAGAPLRRLATDAPLLMPGLAGLGTTLLLGFALNDSGVVVPATGIGLAVPLLVAACATWMLLQQPTTASPHR